jgi:hypothetical protein
MTLAESADSNYTVQRVIMTTAITKMAYLNVVHVVR